MNISLQSFVALAGVFMVAHADARQPSETGARAESVETTPYNWSHVGLLRARDLTPFGLLRLDMLPARTADAKAGTWTFEIQYAYQNTFVMSDNVRSYLESRTESRAPLHPMDGAAILSLPDDAYYFDGEIGLAELVVQRRMNEYWSGYVTVPHIRYGRGGFDDLIESFHDTFGLGQMGRDLVARDQFQFIYRIDGVRTAQVALHTKEGFGDPVIGIRYSLPEPRFGWDVVAEAAAKVAIDGERFLFSTGANDYGLQIAGQRRLGASGRHAIYVSGSAVYFSGGGLADVESGVIPTVIAGYSFGLTPVTSVILQAYLSDSVVRSSAAGELADAKHQYSLGLQTRTRNLLLSLGLTENGASFQNTPDIGLQASIAYMPKAK